MARTDDIIPSSEDTYDGESFTKQSTRGQVAGAAFQLSFKQAETSSALRAIDYSLADNPDDVTDHNELNKSYRLPVPLDAPMSKKKFDLIVQEDIERKELQQVIQRGRPDTTNTVLAFSSGLAAQAVDPVGLALGFGVGAAFTKIAAKGMLGAKAFDMAAAGKVGIGRRMAEGVAGNVIGEAGIVAPVSQVERQGIDVGTSVMHAAMGGVAFPLVMKGMGMGLKQVSNLINLTSGRMDAGKKPFGDANELEFATEVTRSHIDTKVKSLQVERLELEKAEGSEARIAEIDQELGELHTGREAVNKELENHQKMREKANSAEQEMYHSKEVEAEVDKFNEGKERTQLTEEDINTIEKERLDKTYKEMAAEAGEEGAEAIKAQEAEYKARRDSVEEMSNELNECVSGALSGKK